MLSARERALQSGAVNWATKYLTPRNIGRYFGYTAMATAVEVFWNRQRRAGDLTAVLPDYFVRPGATVVDVGASWGLFTYHLAHRVGKAGHVYSYEPHPANAVVLRKLAQARPHVQFRPVAVSDQAGQAQLQVPKHHGRLVTAQSSLAHTFEGIAVERVEVPTVRLDDEIGTALRIDFIKIDVEGHELSVLRGAASLLKRCMPPVLIEIEQRHLDGPISEVFYELEKFGYQVFYIDQSVLRPIAEFDLQHNQLAKLPKDQFTPFSMPKDYVCNFCAVRSPDILPDINLR
jgi:FkbM family methyltransferase